jgi:hypothetical protein
MVKWLAMLTANPKVPNALNVTKTSRFSYAGNTIRIPEDLPEKTLFRSKLNRRRNQVRTKSRWADGVKSNSLRLDALCSRQADMERFSSTGLNQVLVVVPHK